MSYIHLFNHRSKDIQAKISCNYLYIVKSSLDNIKFKGYRRGEKPKNLLKKIDVVVTLCHYVLSNSWPQCISIFVDLHWSYCKRQRVSQALESMRITPGGTCSWPGWELSIFTSRKSQVPWLLVHRTQSTIITYYNPEDCLWLEGSWDKSDILKKVLMYRKEND